MAELRSYKDIGGDMAGMTLEAELRADYTVAGASFRGIGKWMYRLCYTAQTKGVEGALVQHQADWRAELDQAGGHAVRWPPPTVLPVSPAGPQ